VPEPLGCTVKRRPCRWVSPTCQVVVSTMDSSTTAAMARLRQDNSYCEAWEQNRLVQDAVKNMTRSRIEMLEEINKKEAPNADKVVRSNSTLPPTLVRPTLLAVRSAHTGPIFVANSYIIVTIEKQSGRQTGKQNRVTDRRGADIVTRQKRQCRQCLQHGGTKAISCKGRSPMHGA
jgi:hypothetical protein